MLFFWRSKKSPMVTSPSSTLENSRVRVSSVPYPISLFIFFALLLLLPFSFASYSPISYADYCGTVVPESASSAPSAASAEFLDTFKLVNGFFFGGDGLLGSDRHHASTYTRSRFFYFFPRSVRRTQNPGVLQIAGEATFRGDGGFNVIHGRNLFQTGGAPLHRVRPRLPRTLFRRGLASFDLSGYWSEGTGNLCMVGSGHGRSVKGKVLELSAVFKLNYPNISNITSSMVGGTLEILDTANSSNYVEPISVVAYSQKSYEYTQISEAEGSCAKFGNIEESLGVQSGSLCSKVEILSRGTFQLDYQNNCSIGFCSPFTRVLGFTPKTLSLNQIECSDDGKLHMYIGFSNLSYYGFSQIFNPEKSLVGEGIWDKESNRLCLVACHIFGSAGSLANLSVNDCTIRMSLWFPAVWSIEIRSIIVGHIWSTNKMKDNGYFDMISFRDTGVHSDNTSMMKYKYTRVEEARKSCPQGNSAKAGKRRYPDGKSLPDLRFAISLRDALGKSAWGYFNPVSIGEKVFSYSHGMVTSDQVSPPAVKELNQSVMNVSYQISFSYTNNSAGARNQRSILAEGIYDAKKGFFCLVGCQYIDSSTFSDLVKTNDSMDCGIVIDVQLAPLNPEAGEHHDGRIRSIRDQMDPLYFESLEFTSTSIYKEQAVSSMWRMDVEVIMVLISLTLSCVFVIMQLFHVNKDPELLPTISLTMLIILTLGHMIPLVLNFEAMFLVNNRKNVLLSSGGWLEVNEVIVRIIMMIDFLLQFRLLQVSWIARSADEGKKDLWVAEKKALKVCLPLYFAGGLLALFVNVVSNKAQQKQLLDQSLFGELISYAGLILDGFLLPQIIFNIFSKSKGKALALSFYVGNTAVRAVPHVYDAYRSRHYISNFKSSYIYASPNENLYSLVWDIVIPGAELLLSLLIYLQQKFGGTCLVLFKSCWSSGYETVPVTSS